MIKKKDASGPWMVFDTFRSAADVFTNKLRYNENAADNTASNVSVTVSATGFTAGTDSAISSNNLLYAAFA